MKNVIQQGRLRLGLSKQQFAEAVGVSRGAVQQWERENGTAPKRKTQPKVAELLGISVGELMSGSNVTSASADTRGMVPLVSEVQAGEYTTIDNFHPGRSGLDLVPVNIDVRRHTFALRVHGDSMVSASHNSFPEGSILIVEPEMEAIEGDYVIAKNAAGQTTFKQLVKDSGESYLKPLNPSYSTEPLGSALIIGVVREFYKRFR
jgi:SOS-response transcriptional repressor LexA